MTDKSDKWSDLAARLGSAAAMVVIGLAGIFMGGHIFHVLVAIICGLMAWELVGMLSPDQPGTKIQMGLLVGGATLAAIYLQSDLRCRSCWPLHWSGSASLPNTARSLCVLPS